MKKPFVSLEQLQEIVKDYPTPFHLYDEHGIRANARALNQAFSWNPGFKEYFAVKATPNPQILKLLHEEGCGVDCSSLTELMMSDRCGFKGGEIMFSSNDTPAEEFVLADRLGATINLDDITHIDFLQRTIGHIPKKISCRFNPGGTFTLGESKEGFQVMDNPGDAKYGLTRPQMTEAFRRLKELGYIIIYISHKLQEMLTATDEIIVFRNGKKIGQYESKTLDEERLSELIAGRKLEAKFPKKRYPQGKELLRFDHVCVEGYLEDISFTLYEGDILGFAGLLGAGKTEIAKTIFGVFGKNNYNISGKIYFEGKEINAGNPGKSIRNKIGLVPENRASEGLVTDMSVMDNVIMVSLKRMAKFGWIDSKAVKASVDKMIRSLEIKCSGMEQRAGDLSGGNQQKVVLAKWLTLGAKLIIFDEPTRGIDVGAKVAFYELMNELVSEGIGVIIMSSETDEVVNMSDLVVTLKEGRISGVISMRENELLSDKDFQKYM